MIQRIQSIYLFLAAVVSLGSIFLGTLWKIGDGWVGVKEDTVSLVLFLLSAVLSVLSVFMFKNRKRQLSLGLVNIILNVLLIGYLAYCLLNLPGGFSSEKGIGLLAPFISILLLFIANRNIRKDEKLVKSIDRFR